MNKLFISIALLAVMVTACQKDETQNNESSTSPISLPELASTALSEITDSSALSGGSISSFGNGKLSEWGVCWATSSSPTIEMNKTTNTTDSANFTCKLSGLTSATTYYVRAYAKNQAGIAYGNELSFTTAAKQAVVPVIVSNEVSSVTKFTAQVTSSVTSDGGGALTARGVCWATTSTPRVSDNKTSDSIKTGTLTSKLTNLAPNTTYYVRGYATNSAGTAYGTVLSFKTEAIVYDSIADSDGNVYKTVTIGSQKWMAENLRTTKLNDGTSIQTYSNILTFEAQTSAAYYWYNNNKTYGAMYNWYVVNSGQLCPNGWHVPTDADWTALENFLSGNAYNYDASATGNKYAKALAATSGWNTSSAAGAPGNTDYSSKRNASGFSATPAVYSNSDGTFAPAGRDAIWWSATQNSSTTAWIRFVEYSNSVVTRLDPSKNLGFSVRCVKD